MSNAVIWHLLESTLVALMAIAVAFSLHRERAALRYAVCLAAVLKFALPLSLFSGAGAALAHIVPLRRAMPVVLPDLTHLFSRTVTSNQLPASSEASGIGAALATIWFLGSIAMLAQWAYQWRRAVKPIARTSAAEQRALAHGKRQLGINREVLLSSSSVAGGFGVRGIWRPTLIVPADLADRLTPAELESVMLHELAHVRRQDNAWACLVHLLVSIFWFHPLLWWLERRLLLERERACDEMVVNSGAAARDYASGLVKVCRFHLTGSVAGFAGITGSDLKRRVELIMDRAGQGRLPRAAGRLLCTLGAALILLPFAGGFLARARLNGQTITKRAGVEFAGAKVLHSNRSTADHTKTMSALAELFSPYQTTPTAPQGKYGKWLSDDVAYIITAQERERFLALTSDSERDQFIQQFWLAHDPSTGANANKFKEEHYRRIRYANERFGHDIPGRQTDRGRAYIVLGPPDEIDAHPADGWQSWRYQKLDGTADRLELTFATPRSQ